MRLGAVNGITNGVRNLNVLVTGGSSGRLGQKIVTHLSESYPVVTTSSREKNGSVHLPLTSSVDVMKEKIKGCDLVIHSACVSEGSSEKMYDINVKGTEKLFKSCKLLGIPSVFLSTSAATMDGLSSEKTPYAYSKMKAEENAMENGIPIARLGILVGDDNEAVTSLCHMAGVTSCYPSLSVRIPDRVIQPIDYDSAAMAITQIAKLILAGEKFDKSIDIVGDKVLLHEFLDMIKNNSIPIHVELKDLEHLATLVNNGAFNPEFIELAKRGCKAFDNDMLKEMLGENFKSPEEVAIEARKEINLKKVIGIGHKVLANKTPKEKAEFLSALIQLIRVSKSAETCSKSDDAGSNPPVNS